MPQPDDQFAPRCRCSAEQIADGHRHRCPAGEPAYVAVGAWKGLTNEQITHRVLEPLS